MAAEVERRIDAGTYPAGERLPGLVALSTEFGVAVSTIQKALAHLKTQGVVRVELGLGTWPVPPADRG
ncbi:GntR family transcriptional regulator, phosphonate transport system regulatory protein [Streptomyces pini]|uniref:GntR family transcriptional regulator, phosphonate transport system regulatory protein n=1 Tax=Streptomyces pini TaxID=1520580 RepID=A0A1I4EFU5_9ACTN|nr:GntR family transcriptional regulator, phosphonate transport system regulatory protein [Streptomyces pini]